MSGIISPKRTMRYNFQHLSNVLFSQMNVLYSINKRQHLNEDSFLVMSLIFIYQ